VQLLQQWATHWQDLVDFEFVPVVRSKEAGRGVVWLDGYDLGNGVIEIDMLSEPRLVNYR